MKRNYSYFFFLINILSYFVAFIYDDTNLDILLYPCFPNESSSLIIPNLV